MTKRLLKLAIFITLAYFFRGILKELLPLPTERMVEGFLDLDDKTDERIYLFLRFCTWILFIAVVWAYIIPAFNFLIPQTKRYSTTKLYRRVQAGLSFLTVLFVSYLFISIVWGTGTYLVNDKYVEDQIIAEQIKELIPELDSLESDALMKSLRVKKEAEDYINNASKLSKDKSKASLWPFNDQNIDEQIEELISLDERIKNSNGVFGKLIIEIDNPIATDSRYHEYLSSYLEYDRLRKKYDEQYSKLLYYNDTIPLVYERTSQVMDERDLDTKYTATIFFANDKNRTWYFLAALLCFGAIYIPSRFDSSKAYQTLLRFFENGRFGMGGSARFAGMIEEWEYQFSRQKYGLFLGRSLYNPYRYVGIEDNRHMLTIAGTRAGKGATAIIPNLLLWEGSALVIDPKGSNAAVTKRQRAKLNKEVHVVDPFTIAGTETASFNPLEHLDPDDLHIREKIYTIADALVVPDENRKESHWDDSARTVIAGLIAHLISTPEQYEKPNLCMLRDMISQVTEDQIELWAEMSVNEGAGRIAKDAAIRIINGNMSDEIASILSSVEKHTEWLSSPAMEKVLSSSNFSFQDLKNEKTTVYLVIPPQYLETHNRFLRLFINLAIREMSAGGRAKNPVLLIMDEFLSLGRMKEVENAFSLLAGYNLILWPFVQDLGRLRQLYGQSVNSFIANSRAVQVFGVADEETKGFISKYLGDRRLSDKVYKDSAKGAVNLRTPTEVAIEVSIESGRQYILMAGKAPMILEKVPYYNSVPIKDLQNIWSGPFEGKYTPDPDYK